MIFKNLQSVPLLTFSTLKKLFKLGQNTLVKTLIKISFNSHSTYFFMASRNMDFEYLIPVTNHYCKQIVTPTDSLCTMLKKPVKQCKTKQFLLGIVFSIFLTYIFFFILRKPVVHPKFQDFSLSDSSTQCSFPPALLLRRVSTTLI